MEKPQLSPTIFEMESPDQLGQVAREILKVSDDFRVFALYGEMGAGKTTLIKSICQLLGVTSVMASPTFSIVNEYITATNENVYHFDFYRLKNIREAFDIGYENYFFSGNYCFIEWPEKIEPLLDFKHLKIEIMLKDKKRVVFLHT